MKCKKFCQIEEDCSKCSQDTATNVQQASCTSVPQESTSPQDDVLIVEEQLQSMTVEDIVAPELNDNHDHDQHHGTLHLILKQRKHHFGHHRKHGCHHGGHLFGHHDKHLGGHHFGHHGKHHHGGHHFGHHGKRHHGGHHFGHHGKHHRGHHFDHHGKHHPDGHHFGHHGTHHGHGDAIFAKAS